MRDKDSTTPSVGSMTLSDVPINVPAANPITRSLSKSTTRDPGIKHPPPPRAQVKDRAEDDISVQPSTQSNDHVDEHEDFSLLPAGCTQESSCSPIEQLPEEILDAIISNVGGHLGSTGSSARTERARNWNVLMRHPRRKVVSDLALVCPRWRHLVQERVFRHIKIQGTQAVLNDLGDFFLTHPHLQTYVRHLQVIVPIWESKEGAVCQRQVPASVFRDHTGSIFIPGLGQSFTQGGLPEQLVTETTHIFRPASKNAALSEIFHFSQMLFSDLHAVTIEAGHCKRPPQIRFFRDRMHSRCYIPSGPSTSRAFSSPAIPLSGSFFTLPCLPTVKVLILKGAWNVVRQPEELNILTTALPNIQELHTTYHAPKTDAYTAMCYALQPHVLPATIKHLNLCLEGLYAKIPLSLAKWRKVYPAHHICRTLGSLLSSLESLSYTGRVCGVLFSTGMKEPLAKQSKLKRIDIIVSNVCRDPNCSNDASGVHNYTFIKTFEMLVLQAMRALSIYTSVHFLRIRFIDLDAPDPLLNPMFHMENGRARGFWSVDILSALVKARPDVLFEGAVTGDKFVEDLERTGVAGGHRFLSQNAVAAAAVGSISWANEGVRRSHSVDYYLAIAQTLGQGAQG